MSSARRTRRAVTAIAPPAPFPAVRTCRDFGGTEPSIQCAKLSTGRCRETGEELLSVNETPRFRSGTRPKPLRLGSGARRRVEGTRPACGRRIARSKGRRPGFFMRAVQPREMDDIGLPDSLWITRRDRAKINRPGYRAALCPGHGPAVTPFCRAFFLRYPLGKCNNNAQTSRAPSVKLDPEMVYRVGADMPPARAPAAARFAALSASHGEGCASSPLSRLDRPVLMQSGTKGIVVV